MNLEVIFREYSKKVKALGLHETDTVIIASIRWQVIALFINGKSENVYKMSSSKNPPSCIENSLGTPWGLHEVCNKIGKGEPSGMIFEGRKAIGVRYWESSKEKQKRNLITTRILRLVGLEDGVNKGGNVDTYNRYVYIHGTNHEGNLGKPASSGCLQVSNDAVLEIFEKVLEGCHLFIHLEKNKIGI
jgi:hypothetical protein